MTPNEHLARPSAARHFCRLASMSKAHVLRVKRPLTKRLEEAEEKVNNFPFFAQRHLARSGKKWVGMQRQSISAKIKSLSASSGSAGKLDQAVAYLEQLKNTSSGTLAAAAMKRLQIFASEKKEESGNKEEAAEDHADKVMSPAQDKLVKEWLLSKVFTKDSTMLLETRKKRKLEARHLRERVGRKDRRLADVEEKKKKPRPRPEPLVSQKEMFLQSLGTKPKNRMGQRERKRLAQEMERKKEVEAGHEAPMNRKERRELVRKGILPPEQKKAKVEPTSTSTSAPSKPSETVVQGESEDAHENHPSWIAKRKKEQEQKNVSFSGNKMTFDDSGEDDMSDSSEDEE